MNLGTGALSPDLVATMRARAATMSANLIRAKFGEQVAQHLSAGAMAQERGAWVDALIALFEMAAMFDGSHGAALSLATASVAFATVDMKLQQCLLRTIVPKGNA